ncbi:DUF4190 domain-containing protein [Streptomyces xanthochromogenes]|uniref:DUF4190 domain-containing protein n=1 Tax=Streptomyces xanthochromogenes TaxID=67384 RepID=A0ABQ3ASU1_9ACTN|nr:MULTISPECIES: DUF4190 domain-containing protein [Streptomyces]MYV90790.1 hypothetical protein [Streptomyces sp. SID1034]GGY63072.1 hypothetical protein GCM10010326_67350 [Streptomyces xanthochromogenes]
MSDNTQQPSGGQEPRDPWAPPERKVPLDKPSVHDQQTVVSMPGTPTEGQYPAPPQGAPGAPAQGPFPGAPGQQAPGSGYGGPTPPPAPGQAAPGSYGYPAYPQQPGQGYPGYPGQQPVYGYPGFTGMTAPQNGFGTAGMVLGIIGCVLLFCTIGIAGIVLGTLALIFGMLGKGRVARGEANNRGQSLAGITLGIISIVLGLALLVIVIATGSLDHPTSYDYSNFLSSGVLAR